eukprot:350454-Chlamydomonas_euryale.AAC.4
MTSDSGMSDEKKCWSYVAASQGHGLPAAKSGGRRARAPCCATKDDRACLGSDSSCRCGDYAPRGGGVWACDCQPALSVQPRFHFDFHGQLAVCRERVTALFNHTPYLTCKP